MKLISCTIENFGKLNNVTYDFSGECNTICEDNGWGKSTLASFIRVMFYGFKNESKKKLVDKERNRLMPWQKGVYGGEIVFETGGVVYSLRRTFGKKQADDEFLLVRKDTNVECDDFSCDIGEELFKIDAQSFERTVFIGQSDCVTATTDSINAKIGNLADNTDDINNFAVTSKNAFKNVEYEANLFAVSLLFNESDFNMKVLNISNYLLKQVLDYNIAVEGKGYLWNFQM
jgi:DNA repair exonuclease SbcCD ATPase subunit